MIRKPNSTQRKKVSQPKRRPGGQIKPQAVGNRVWSNRKACVAALGISLSVLEAIRASGCQAFRNGRIYEADLLPSLKEFEEARQSSDPLPDDEYSLKKLKLQEDIRWRKLNNDYKEGIQVDAMRIIRTFGQVGARVRELLDRKLRVEYPNQVHGLTVEQTKEFGCLLADQILAEFEAMASLWQD